MALEGYRELIQRFLDGEMAAYQFKRRYLTAFRNEPVGMPAEAFDVLAELYCLIDCFWPCTNDAREEEMPQEETPEEELRAEAARTLQRLTALVK